MTTVSVIIPTYERDEFLKRAVESVLNQTYHKIEIIIVDDGSNIPAKKVLEPDFDLQSESIFICRHENNQGANAARRTGMETASGKYLAFLDDDDEWLEEKIERQIDSVENSTAEVVYTGVEQMNNGTTSAIKSCEITGDIKLELLQRNFIGTFSSVLISKTAMEMVGYPDEDLPSWQDWDYYLRLSEDVHFESVPEALTIQHGHNQDKISGNYHRKRDITAPLFLQKHLEKAQKCGIEREFEATISAELGWSALGSNEYSEARKHFYHSLRKKHSKHRLLLFLLTIGGGRSFNAAQKVKRAIPVIDKFKKQQY